MQKIGYKEPIFLSDAGFMFGKLLRGGITQPLPELPTVFQLAGNKRLQLQHDQNSVSMWRYLSHQIRREPHDLQAHIQRVLLAQHEKLQDRLVGSLQDLFIALGDAGQLLRERVFIMVKDSLSPNEQAYFQSWLSNKLELNQDQVWHKGSLLTTGLAAKTVRLINVERTQSVSEYANVMDEVLACLEYGQIDTARDLLEAELHAGRVDNTIEQELINIYQYTRDRERLDAMLKYLQESGLTFDPVWLEKQQDAQQW